MVCTVGCMSIALRAVGCKIAPKNRAAHPQLSTLPAEISEISEPS